MSDITISVNIETTQASKNVKTVSSDIKGLGESGKAASIEVTSGFDRIGNVANIALGNIASNAVNFLGARLKSTVGDVISLAAEAGKYATEIDTMAQRTQLGTDAVQELQFITEQAGVSFGAVESAADSFRRRIPQIESGTGRASEAFGQLDVNLHDTNGNLRSTGELLPEIIEELSGMEDESRRNIIAQEVLGRNYSQLIPLLDMNQDALKGMRDELHDNNQIMSGDTIKALRDYDDEMARMNSRLDTVRQTMGVNIARGVTPWIASMSDGLVVINDWLDDTPRLSSEFVKQRQEVENLNGPITTMIERYEELKSQTELNTDEQSDMDGIIKDLAKSLPATASEFDKYGQVIGINTERAKDYINQQERIHRFRVQDELEERAEKARELAAEYRQAGEMVYQLSQMEEGEGEGFGPTLGLKDVGRFEEEMKGAKTELESVLAGIQELGIDLDDQEVEISKYGRTWTVNLKEIAESINFFGGLEENSDNLDAKLAALNEQYQELMNKAKLSAEDEQRLIKIKAERAEIEEEMARRRALGNEEEAEELKGLSDELNDLKERYEELINLPELSDKQFGDLIDISTQMNDIEEQIDDRIQRIKGERGELKVFVKPEFPEDDIVDDLNAMDLEMEMPLMYPIDNIRGQQEELSDMHEKFANAINETERQNAAERIDELELEIEAKRVGISTEKLEREEAHEENMANMAEALEFANQMAQSIGQININQHRSRIQQSEEEKRTRIEAINARMKTEERGTAQYHRLANQREQAEEQFDAKIRKQRREMAKAERRNALFQIAIQTAVNIVKAGGLIRGIAMGAIGAAQAAAVASQPLPEYKRGGQIIRLSNGEFFVEPQQAENNLAELQQINRSGMVRGPGSGTSDSITAIAPERGYIVNAEATRHNRNRLEQIAQGYRSGGSIKHKQQVERDMTSSSAGIDQEAINQAIERGLSQASYPIHTSVSARDVDEELERFKRNIKIPVGS